MVRGAAFVLVLVIVWRPARLDPTRRRAARMPQERSGVRTGGGRVRDLHEHFISSPDDASHAPPRLLSIKPGTTWH